MKFWTLKKEGKLYPLEVEDQIKMNKLPLEPVLIKYTQVRNPKFHRLYFKFIDTVWQNLPEKFDKHWPNRRSFRKAMECYSGHFIETISLKGERMIQPKSIAYGELDDIEFGELYKEVKKTIGKYILPEMDLDIVENEIEQFYG